MPLDANIISEETQDAASVWLSRRDRGLAAGEQDAYLEWLYQDPRHGRAIVQLERVWATLNKLEQWRPAHSAVPNPDLLLPRRSPWAKAGLFASVLATAAAVTLALYLGKPAQPEVPTVRREAIIHPGAERLTLADGSLVDLSQGAKIDVHFTDGERHVQLLSGEAYFTVAHNADRPFFVDTGKISVRAVGTAFSVSLASTEVTLLVTEGKVEVIEQAEQGGEPVTKPEPLYYTAGQRTIVSLSPEAPVAPPSVQTLTPTEIDRALSWQAMRLEFVDMPLGDVVAEFSHYNRQRISLADETTAAILVGGNFRADNVEAFVRLLADSFGVSAFRNGNEIVLRKTR